MSEQPDPVDMAQLTFTDTDTDALAPDVPSPTSSDDVMVARTRRIPVELDQWIERTAAAKGLTPSDLVRQLLALGRAAYEEADRPVSMADILTAIMAVRSRDAA